MEETEKITRKLPHQEIDYFKIGKILLSRWYWIAASVAVTVIISYIYLWYTPKTYSTGGTLKIEEKKSEISDVIQEMNTPDRGPSKIQSIISVLQSRNLIVSAIKDIDYRISFYISGRIRITETYPQKPLSIDLIKFDSLNFYHDLISFKSVNAELFDLTYKVAGKDVQKSYNYNSPITIGATTFSIKNPGFVGSNTIYLFKFNNPDDYVDRVRNGLRAGETAKNSNIIALQETDSNPQFAADVLNTIMNEYVIFDRNQKSQSASQMIDFIDTQLSFLSNQVKNSGNSIEKFKQASNILDVNTAATTSSSKATELETNVSLLKIQLIALNELTDQVTKEKDNVNLNFNIGGSEIPALQALISKLDNMIAQRTSLLKTFTYNSQFVQDINQQILQTKATALYTIKGLVADLQKKIGYYNSQLSQVNQTLSALPAAQRYFTA